jgi:hypothetical protein
MSVRFHIVATDVCHDDVRSLSVARKDVDKIPGGPGRKGLTIV